jgi:hypothetical protein
MSRANPRFRRANPPLPPPVNNCYQANVLFTSFSQQFLATLYYADNQALGTGVNPTALNAAVTAGLASFQPVFATDVAVTGVITRSLTSPTVISQTRMLAAPLVGTAAGLSEGTIAAATIRRTTVIRGQAGRGHVNLGPVPDAFITAGGTTLTPAAIALYSTWATTNLGTVITSGGINFTPIVFSRGLRTQTPKLLGASPVNTLQVIPLLGTVRRRKIGRGK